MEPLLTLTRKSTNADCTLGEIRSSDGVLKLQSMEARLPADRLRYISWCLPPSTYEVYVTKCPITYRGIILPAYWPFICRVPGFPKAGFFCMENLYNKYGYIKLATTYVDDFTLSGYEDAVAHVARWAKRVYDDRGEQPFSMVIEQDELTIRVTDITEREYREQEKEKELQRMRELYLKEIYGDT